MEVSDVDINVAPPPTSALLKTDSNTCDVVIISIDHLGVWVRMDEVGK